MSDDYTWAYCNDQTVRYMVDTGEDAQAIIGQRNSSVVFG